MLKNLKYSVSDQRITSHGEEVFLDLRLVNKQKLPFAVTATDDLGAFADVKLPSDSG